MHIQPASESAPSVSIFFYGSYMNRQVLSDIGLTPREREVASLPGFDIDVRPLANVVRSAGHTVWGIVTAATHPELDRVYAHAHNVLGRLYLPHGVLVETVGGVFRPALCYIAAPAEPDPATNEYLDRVVAAAREHELPAAYIERLESFRPAR